MEEKIEKLEKINWSDVVSIIEKDHGIPKNSVVECVKAVESTVKQIIVDKRPKAKGEVLLIKTPIVAYTATYIPEHDEADSKGKMFHYSECIGIAANPPREFVTLANTGFECTKKAIEK